MTKTRRTPSQNLQTAGALFESRRSEALRRLRLITAAVEAAGRGKTVNWGDAGDMGAVVERLGWAGHYAGVEELTER